MITHIRRRGNSCHLKIVAMLARIIRCERVLFSLPLSPSRCSFFTLFHLQHSLFCSTYGSARTITQTSNSKYFELFEQTIIICVTHKMEGQWKVNQTGAIFFFALNHPNKANSGQRWTMLELFNSLFSVEGVWSIYIIQIYWQENTLLQWTIYNLNFTHFILINSSNDAWLWNAFSLFTQSSQNRLDLRQI